MPSQKDKTGQAIAAVLLTAFALALGDAIIKGISTSFTLWQIFVIRSLVVMPIVGAMIKLRGVSLLPRFVGWTVLRSLMLTIMWVTYYAALPHVDLSLAAAAYYTLPLFITLFAALFLGDTIGKVGWFAIGLGFVGVILVLNPQVEGFNWYAALPISSAILFALAMILTRSKCQSESVFVLSFWVNLSMFVIGIIATLIVVLLYADLPPDDGQAFLLGRWAKMDWQAWGVIGVLSTSILISSIGASYAYQNGPPATITAFDFAYVAFAVLWGVVIFQETPSVKAAAGILLIVAAGILAVRRKIG